MRIRCRTLATAASVLALGCASASAQQATGIAVKGRKGGKVIFNTEGPVHISDYGEGKIIFCSYPIENECILNEAYPEERHMRIYSEIAGGMNDW